jgi:putative transposase
MWTPTTRRQHNRDHLRYGSDLTDAEWEIIAPYLPAPAATGRPRRWPRREIMNAIFYPGLFTKRRKLAGGHGLSC